MNKPKNTRAWVVYDKTGMVIGMNYRLLNEGEIILETDEYLDDVKGWVTSNCVGERAPNPNYTSHRKYRRKKQIWDREYAPLPETIEEVEKELKLQKYQAFSIQIKDKV